MLLNVFHRETSDKELAAAVESALIRTLYASRLSLIIGALLGCALSVMMYYYCPLWQIQVAGIALSTFGGLRVASFQLYSADSGADRLWRYAYELGAIGYAALLGVLAALIVLLSPRYDLHFIMGVMATGYAAAAASRNTGRPHVAISQFLLTQAPWTVALLATPTPIHLLLFGSNILFALIVTDITLLMYRIVYDAFLDKQEKLQLAAVYERLSKTDALTGIGNRTIFETSLNVMLTTAQGLTAVIWLDLDQFKQVNDTLGHAAGDRLLRCVALTLPTTAGEAANVARFGGDEFVISIPVVSEADALQRGERVLAAIRSTRDPEDALPEITASAGIAISGPGGSVDALLRHADLALYDAKAQGRDRVSLFDPAMERDLLRRKALEHDLKQALQSEQLHLHFQPIIDLQTGFVSSFEALLRWTHPEHGPIPPTSFIPMAESAKIMAPLTSWVLSKACAAAQAWPDHVSVAVNISPTTVQGGGLIAAVMEALLSSGLHASRLELELTESAIIEDSPHANSLLDTLKKLGVRLSLDDFGTGFSSLSYLCRYKFDTIKIDRSFTSTAERKTEAHAVIQAISTLAKSMKMAVVAEGIETVSQANYIIEQNCQFGQGYLFSKPVPFETTLELIGRNLFIDELRGVDEHELKLAS